MRTCYIRIPDLEEEWRASKMRPGASKNLIRKYGTFQVLVLDEWLLDKPDDDFRSMIMELMEPRCDGKSTIFCTQYQKMDWHARLRGGVHADAIMDRIGAHRRLAGVRRGKHEGEAEQAGRPGNAGVNHNGRHR